MVKKTVKKSVKKPIKKSTKKSSIKKTYVTSKAPSKNYGTWKKSLVAGLLGGVTLMLLNFLSSLISYSQSWYATTFPGMTTALATGPVIFSSFASGLIVGYLYPVLSKGLNSTGIKKGLCYGFKIWLIVGIPWLIMILGVAPFKIWALDLLTGLFTYLFLGLVIDLVYRRV